jgi:hypothetical protein
MKETPAQAPLPREEAKKKSAQKSAQKGCVFSASAGVA